MNHGGTIHGVYGCLSGEMLPPYKGCVIYISLSFERNSYGSSECYELVGGVLATVS